jgi:t-SNARE complex subunit (syntaxin)
MSCSGSTPSQTERALGQQEALLSGVGIVIVMVVVMVIVIVMVVVMVIVIVNEGVGTHL